MEIRLQFNKLTQPPSFLIPQYKSPRKYLDSAKIQQQKQNIKKNYITKNIPRKFTPSKKKKQFFLDQDIKKFKDNPSPSTYQIEFIKTTNKKPQNSKQTKKPSKSTYIDLIQRQQAKRKTPGIGKYNLLTLTDFTTEKKKKLKNKKNPQSINIWSEAEYLSAKVPGPGQYNAYKSVQKIKEHPVTYKIFKQKNKLEKNQLKRSQSVKLGPTSYNTVWANTFDSLKKKYQNKSSANRVPDPVEIRKGRRSLQKLPGPAQYQLINQWSASKESWRGAKSIGKVDLLKRTAKSARTLSVYRD